MRNTELRSEFRAEVKGGKHPEPHQQAALDSIAAEMLEADRALVVMACGTGKTLVELWAAEALRPKRVLVLVPTLGLMQQTLNEWQANASPSSNMNFLCVCSDEMIAADRDEITPEFPTCIDPILVKDFLDWCDEDVMRCAVVFSTYHSTPVVGEAMQLRANEDRAFDVAIFDEAHKTVGDDDKSFAFALKDERLSIFKRLFFTATPRVVLARKVEGERVVGTMDDVSVYGRRVFNFGIPEAVKRGIVVPYKVIVSVIAEHAPQDADLLPLVTSVDSRSAEPMVAGAIALKRAVGQFGLRKAITFHNTVDAAKRFAHLIGDYLHDFHCLHVSGRQAPGVRAGAMALFRGARQSVVTNARCLTEGIDVPTVDLIAFMDPRKSKVDVVQALGRAMRRSEAAKECCYVFLPLHLDLRVGESLEEALDRSAFSGVAGILASLVENDADLMELFRTMSWAQGSLQTGIESKDRFYFQRVSGVESAFVEKLLSAIETRLIYEVAGSWNRRIGELIAFKKTHGHCNVSGRDGGKLGFWLSHQRTAGRRGELSEERRRHLEDVGVVFEDPRDIAWDARFAELLEFHKIHGHCRVPVDAGPLGVWVKMQRERSKLKGYRTDRKERLSRLGFDFAVYAKGGDKISEASRARFDAIWNQRFRELEEFKREHGHCNVSQLTESTLGWWVSRQRSLAKRSGYPMERRAALIKLGFVFDMSESSLCP